MRNAFTKVSVICIMTTLKLSSKSCIVSLNYWATLPTQGFPPHLRHPPTPPPRSEGGYGSYFRGIPFAFWCRSALREGLTMIIWNWKICGVQRKHSVHATGDGRAHSEAERAAFQQRVVSRGAGHKLPMRPTTWRWSQTDSNTIPSVLCHEGDDNANQFLKKEDVSAGQETVELGCWAIPAGLMGKQKAMLILITNADENYVDKVLPTLLSLFYILLKSQSCHHQNIKIKINKSQTDQNFNAHLHIFLARIFRTPLQVPGTSFWWLRKITISLMDEITLNLRPQNELQRYFKIRNMFPLIISSVLFFLLRYGVARRDAKPMDLSIQEILHGLGEIGCKTCEGIFDKNPFKWVSII